MCWLPVASGVVEEIRPYLEVVFFLSGIGLFVVGCFGLKQLSLVKEDILVRNTRAAREKALEAARAYNREFIPTYNEYYEKLKQVNLVAYKGEVGDFTTGSLGLEAKKRAAERAKLLPGAGLDALNAIDWIASMFVHGVADEKAGFKMFGRSFCAFVANNYDLFALWQHDFQSTERLYQTWSPRIKKEELAAARVKLDQDIASIEEPHLDQIEPNV